MIPASGPGGARRAGPAPPTAALQLAGQFSLARPGRPGLGESVAPRAAGGSCGGSATAAASSLRAGFVTYAHLRGASDRAIAHQTRHRSLATIGVYIRVQAAWTDNAATTLGF